MARAEAVFFEKKHPGELPYHRVCGSSTLYKKRKTAEYKLNNVERSEANWKNRIKKESGEGAIRSVEKSSAGEIADKALRRRSEGRHVLRFTPITANTCQPSGTSTDEQREDVGTNTAVNVVRLARPVPR
ncbi:hypothetical protein K0M31_015336 [Melipona bicolor]|uniref:Uncharacterized protein n=1 Tax=Melipona bicolor TaxID=60889 RepID=A0AA40FFG3_9HYME|nr:hypothetical protein K0M31_015336 [Melipona bicolor]